MDDARIAELLAPFLSDRPKGRSPEGIKLPGDGDALSPNQVRDISTYIDLLLRWNARFNLTAVREPEEIVTRHFGESIFAARHLFSRVDAGTTSIKPSLETPHLIDVGSGAGFPGLPVKIWAPQAHLTLIEANQKKATFLREVVRSLNLTDVDVFAGRASVFAGSKGDVVTLRAVERFESILPVAVGLVSPTGRLALLAADDQLRSVRELAPGLRWSEPVRLPMSASRILIMGSKEPQS